MISRYTLPEMGRIWSDHYRMQKWLEIELLACEAQAELGLIPPEAVEAIRQRAGFTVERVQEIEATTNHDVIAFLTAVAERVGEESKYIHLGMTSSDILDTGLALQMRDAADILLEKIEKLRQITAQLALKHKYTLMIGRTHGVHAEPTTFGLKMALWAMELDRDQKRLEEAKRQIAVGKISGAVGTFANIDPRVEEYVLRKLGLTPDPVSTQIIQRDRHAFFLTTLAVVASSLEKFATEIRNLQRTEILEVEEPFGKGQKGSSAMPHKKNPITAERVAGLARVVRANAMAALEDVALWHERDLTHSSVERVIIPDSTILLDYMLAKFTGIMEGLVVHPQRMRENLERTQGLIFSQRVLLALVESGILRETAYQWVQRNALRAWEEGVSFRDLVKADADIGAHLDAKTLDGLFDYNYHLKQVDYIFKRAGLS
ncbi:MAG: adenylosuccinate lyase [Clostridia bacterium]|nr:adenylosuccinate lyase [Clostridia bacterium]